MEAILKSSFSETGAMPTPTKLWNPTVCGWGGPFHLYLTHSQGFFPAFLKVNHTNQNSKEEGVNEVPQKCQGLVV